MASRKLFYGRPGYVYPYLETEITQNDQNEFEFDESDVYSINEQLPTSFDTRKPVPVSRSLKKQATTADSGGVNRRTRPAAGSLPVNVPDWSKILKSEYRCRGNKRDSDAENVDDHHDDDYMAAADCGSLGVVIPPHEYLARRRGTSFSVNEGFGRTLKGRDLWRVRNAIWEKTGFQD